jgi:hypothetical protein
MVQIANAASKKAAAVARCLSGEAFINRVGVGNNEGFALRRTLLGALRA